MSTIRGKSAQLFLRGITFPRKVSTVLSFHKKCSYGTIKQVKPTSTTLQSELIFRSEDDQSFKVFKTLSNYKNTFFPNPEIPQKTNSPTIKNFVAVSTSSNTKSVCSEDYQDLRLELLDKISSLSDQELATTIYHLRFFPRSPSAFEPEFHKLWKRLDDECISRMSTWNLDFALSIDNLWYEIFLTRFCDFHWNLKKKLFRKCDNLSKEHYIRFLFNINNGRRFPAYINTYDVEHKLYSLSDHLTSAEIVIIALAFFKTETKIRDPEILSKLLQKTMEDSKTLDSVSVSAISKLARHSSNGKYTLVDFFHSFQGRFIPEIDRLSISACVHLALVGTKLQIPNKELIMKVVKKMEEKIHETRLKEFERLTFSMTTFNINCDSLCHKIIQELRSENRCKEISEYGRCLPSILHYFTFRHIFPIDLISKVLAPEFLLKYYGSNHSKYQRELLSLEMTVGIELPDYNGPRLEDKIRLSLLKLNNLWLNKPLHSVKEDNLTKYETLFRKVRASANKLFGEEYIFACNILPQHHSIEIVFCVDENDQIVIIPNWLKERKLSEPKYIPHTTDGKKLTYHAIFVASRGSTEVYSEELLGHTVLQLRLLEKIGYKTHIIYAYRWVKDTTAEQQIQNLYDLIRETSPDIKFDVNKKNVVLKST